VNQRTRAVDIRRGILAAFVAAVALSLLAVPRGAGADSGTTEALRSKAAQVMADIDRQILNNDVPALPNSQIPAHFERAAANV